MPPRRPGHRAGLSSEQILEAARELVLQYGAEPLTMRRLADHLGVAPNTLYSHYPNKAALMDAVLDSLLGDIELPDLTGTDWRDGLVLIMDASRKMLVSHPDLLPLLFSRPIRGPNVIRLGEATLDLLSRGGVEGHIAVVALRAMLMLTFGWVAIDAPRRLEPDPSSRQAETHAAYSGQDQGRRMAELAEPLSRQPSDATFEKSLRWLIEGIAGGTSDSAVP
jgi:TetR/AcrR family transcriptional regulator, tetracycline repressor protein